MLLRTEKYFSVWEVAKLLGISKQTLIRYENREIFPKPRRNYVNKWREYTLQDVKKLKEILGRDT